MLSFGNLMLKGQWQLDSEISFFNSAFLGFHPAYFTDLYDRRYIGIIFNITHNSTPV